MRWLSFLVFFIGYGVAIAGGKEEKTPGQRYSNTLNQFLHNKNLKFAIPWQQDMVSDLIKRMDELPFNKIAENPTTAQKISKVGTRLLANEALINSIAKAKGVDFLNVMAQVARLISDMEKLRVTNDKAEIKKTRERIFATTEKLTSNKALLIAARDALITHGAFLAQIVREEKLITSTLGQKEFLAELAKYEEGKLISEIIDIPVALQKAEEITAKLLSNKELLNKILRQETSESFGVLFASAAGLVQEMGSSGKKTNIDVINAKTLDLLKNVIDNGELISMMISTLAIDVALTPAQVKNICQEVKYTDLKTLNDRLIADSVFMRQ